MFRKLLSLLLTSSMLVISGVSEAGAKTIDAQAHSAKIKAEARRLGAGERARVELNDKTKLSGTIVEIGEDQLVLRESKTNQNLQLPYAGVRTLWGATTNGSKILLLGASAFQSKTALIVLVVLLGTVVALVASDKS